MCVYVCACVVRVCVRERDRHTHTQKQRQHGRGEKICHKKRKENFLFRCPEAHAEGKKIAPLIKDFLLWIVSHQISDS